MKPAIATILTIVVVIMLANPAAAAACSSANWAKYPTQAVIPLDDILRQDASSYQIPVFLVVDVTTDQTVSIETVNLSANDTLKVLMANNGTMGIGGIEVGTINSGSGGIYKGSYGIPTLLRGSYQIAIRLESSMSGLAYSDSFYNDTSGVIAPAAASASAMSSLFSVLSVVRDTSVTLQLDNTPANDAYDVFMGSVDAQGINDTKVATIFTGNGGSFYKIISIPGNLHGVYQIALRLESPYSGYYSYQLFNNNTTGSYGVYYTSSSYGLAPTFSIVNVVKDAIITIQTANFPANDTFYVRMGPMGTAGINGTYVGTINSGSGGTFQATFSIPNNLIGSYQISVRLESPYSGYYSYNWFTNATGSTSYTPYIPYTGIVPTFSVVNVVKDSTVTIQTANFPAGDTFNARMGPMGTQGINGTYVGSISSGAGGTFQASFNVPNNLIGSYQIALRLESPTSGYYSYNWFYNNTGSAPPSPSPVIVPTFSIAAVVKDTSVTILTANFPASDTFNVTMGAYGTQGIGGILVGTVNSGAGGTFTATFNVPAALIGSYKIAIRLQSPTSGYYSYNWFYNNNAP
jgi:hypothetical protein